MKRAEIKQAVFEAIGEASTTWSEAHGNKVFDSSHAERICNELMAKIEAYAKQSHPAPSEAVVDAIYELIKCSECEGSGYTMMWDPPINDDPYAEAHHRSDCYQCDETGNTLKIPREEAEQKIRHILALVSLPGVDKPTEYILCAAKPLL